ALEGITDLGGRLTAACVLRGENGPRPVPLSQFSHKLFEGDDPEKARMAVRGLLRALAEPQRADVPRFRLHWMARTVDGIWSSLESSSAGNVADKWRTVGRLYNDAGHLHDESGTRILETLYCDACGTLYLAGYRSEADAARQLPGQPAANGIELL